MTQLDYNIFLCAQAQLESLEVIRQNYQRTHPLISGIMNSDCVALGSDDDDA